jgi:hypothetical protein
VATIAVGVSDFRMDELEQCARVTRRWFSFDGVHLPRLFSVACICFGHVHKGLVIMGFISYVDLRFLVHVDVLPTMKF